MPIALDKSRAAGALARLKLLVILSRTNLENAPIVGADMQPTPGARSRRAFSDCSRCSAGA
jgi:hypothetical protein